MGWPLPPTPGRLGKSRFLESSGSRPRWQRPLRAPAPCPELVCGLILGLAALGVPKHPSAAVTQGIRSRAAQGCARSPPCAQGCAMVGGGFQQGGRTKGAALDVAEQCRGSPGHLPAPESP